MQQVTTGGVPQHVSGFVRSLQRRLWWRSAVASVLHGVSLGALGGLLLVLYALWEAREPLFLPSLLVFLGLVVAGLAVARLRRPSLDDAARLADRHLRLDERLATALEIVQGRLSTPLAARQLEDAWQALQGRPLDALPPLAPSPRTAVLAAALLGLFLPSLVVASRVDPANNPIAALRQGLEERLARGDLLAAHLLPASLRQTAEASDPFADSPPAPFIDAETEQQLREQVARSRAQQAALAHLARALMGTAAAREIGQQLQRGDYAQAAASLQELGRRNDQLSREGKLELATALHEAVAAIERLSPELASEVEQAAEALTRGDYRSMQEALERLGLAVDEASREVVPQQELAQAWQRLQDERRGLEDGFFDYDEEMGMSAFGHLDMLDEPVDGGYIGVFDYEDEGWAEGSAGGVGGSAGAYNPDAEPTRLNVAGREVELEGRPGSAGEGTRPAGPGSASLGFREGTETDALREGDDDPSTRLVDDIAERTSIPLGHQRTVHDYFHHSAEGATP